LSPLAEEERDDLPLVNALREDVRRWRASGWENASHEEAAAPLVARGSRTAANPTPTNEEVPKLCLQQPAEI
jgi:hypothetical protein